MAKVYKTSASAGKNPWFNNSSKGGASKALQNINNVRYSEAMVSGNEKFGYGISDEQWKRGSDPYATLDRFSESKPSK